MRDVEIEGNLKIENVLESNFEDSDCNQENTTKEKIRYTELNENFDDNPLGFSEYKDSRLPSINNNSNNNISKNNKNSNNKHSYLPSNKSYKINKNQFKIILIGDSSVGKTSIINRYIDNKFTNKFESTITVETKKKLYQIDNDNIAELNIWDTAGEEKFRTITNQFYKDTHGALIVYDITNKESFERINFWLKDLIDFSPPDIIIYLIGNKIDLEKKREVEFNEGKKYSEENNILFNEVSAKNGNNVSAIFDILSNKIFEKKKKEENNVNKYKRRNKRGTIEINRNSFKRNNNNHHKKGCC